MGLLLFWKSGAAAVARTLVTLTGTKAATPSLTGVKSSATLTGRKPPTISL